MRVPRLLRHPRRGAAARSARLGARPVTRPRIAFGAEAFAALLKEDHAFGLKLWRSPGCTACTQTGYKGRVALHELLVGSDHLKRTIQRKAPIDDVRKVAAEGGMVTLLQDGVRKVLARLTDLKQVLAVCSR